jgi:beta-lactamase superfamily II metal-dependent hydrolase/predicted membrane metal-binding protein
MATGKLTVILKIVFTRIIRILEICALPYILGIAFAVGFQWRLPPEWLTITTKLSLWGVLALLYLPPAIAYAGHIFARFRRAKGTENEANLAFFLEDEFSEFVFTRLVVVLFIVASFFFGTINFNLAIETSSANHLVHYLAKPGERDKAIVRGEIIREPEFRDANVWLYMKPDIIRPATAQESDASIPIDRGLILAKISKKVTGYEDFEYGQRIELTGVLTDPEPATNPGSFNYKKYLNNRNIFALMTIYREDQIKLIGEGKVNFLVHLSLELKKKFIRIMKQTLPYPHSAFQGGIIYGLKTGLPFESHWEFKWAGMAWILVVAGAHLLMVYLTLKMILESVRPNPKVGFLILFLLLFIFLIITGINPPTVRAFIMLFLYEFSRVFLGQDIKSAVSKAVAIAAFLLLASHAYPYFSPLMIFDPTVTLSFGAVLSLSYLSRPIERLFRRYLYGLNAIVALFTFLGIIAILIIRKPVTMTQLINQISITVISGLLAMIVMAVINNRFRDRNHLSRIHLGYNTPEMYSGFEKWLHPSFFSYNNLPRGVISFLGAQVAIQFGMVMPLSSLYFQRSPIAGLLANLIGFPALGFIIQVGLIAVLLGLIPVIGLPLAFVLNAADYLGIDLLIKVAHYSSKLFSYPMAAKPLPRQLFFYYGVILLFILFDRFFYDPQKHEYLSFSEFFSRRTKRSNSAFVRAIAKSVALGSTRKIMIGAVLIVLGSGAYWLARPAKVPMTTVIVMELDGGSGSIIKTPGGAKFLIDGGKNDPRTTFDPGEKTIAPVLLCQQIETLDGVILSKIGDKNLGGLAFILDNFVVKKFYSPYDPTLFNPSISLEQFLTAAAGRAEISDSSRKYFGNSFDSFVKLCEVVKRKSIPLRQIAAGDRLIEEGAVTLSALSPLKGVEFPGSLVLRLAAGSSGFLFTGDAEWQDQETILQNAPQLKLQSDAMLVPGHGGKRAYSNEFLRAVKPRMAVLQYTEPFRGRDLGKSSIGEVTENYSVAAVSLHRTDQSGAVIFQFDQSGDMTVSAMM